MKTDRRAADWRSHLERTVSELESDVNQKPSERRSLPSFHPARTQRVPPLQ
ncbi:hypothetical protein PC116_g29159 [Phytophthora cactorum]|nr:hypothetical protein PC119_g26843 [Phytophthora cactorum]KAG4222367.1 hypothetical protein PC116_g29159 [Phytophthora cactorum]